MTKIRFTTQDLGATFQIRVTPKAAANRIVAEHMADGSKFMRIYVTAVPEDGKANKAVIAMLAKYLGIPKSSLEIIKSSTGKDKTVLIHS